MPKICLMCGENFPDTTTFCPKDGSALRAAVVGDDLIGELIAERYLITDLLSHGGMGSVYKASDVRLPQLFAVKVLRQQQSPDPSLITRFRQEAEAVCRINHDRVARVFDFGFMPDDRAYIIMEYVDGRTLKHLLDERGALDPLEAAKIIQMAAEGIDAAHRLGIVHRDLKPENVMILDDPGGGTRVKVLDFGIAKLQSADPEKGQTQPGFVIGTPAWMSPEQLLGEAIDARSDVYSLGLLTFALLTGQRAFSGDTEQAEMLARITTTPRTLAEAAPHIVWPAEVQALFDRTLSRDMTQRPSTTLQFANALHDAVVQWKETTGGRVKPVSAGQAAVSRDAVTIRLKRDGAVLDVSTQKSAPRATPATTSSNVATSSSRRTMLVSVIGVTVVGASVLAYVLTRSNAGPNTGDASTPPVASSVTAADSLRVAAPPASATLQTNVPPADSGDARRDTANTPAAPVVASAPIVKPDVPRGTPPTTSAAAPKTPAVSPPAVALPTPSGAGTRNQELARIMKAFDNDELNATQTIAQIEALSGKLGALDQAWAQIYFGNAYFQLGDKTKACAAYVRASSLAGDSKVVRDDSEEKRLMIGCRP